MSVTNKKQEYNKKSVLKPATRCGMFLGISGTEPITVSGYKLISAVRKFFRLSIDIAFGSIALTVIFV